MFLNSRKIIIDGIIPIIKESNNNYRQQISLVRKCLKDYKISPFRWTYIKLVPLYPLDNRTKGIDILGIGKGCSLFGTLIQNSQHMRITGLLGKETTDGTVEGDTVSLQSTEHITWADLSAVARSLIGERNFAPTVSSESTAHFNSDENFQTAHYVPGSTNVKHVEMIKSQNSLPHFEMDLVYTGHPAPHTLTSKFGELLGTGACVVKATRTNWGPFSTQGSSVLPESQITPQNVIKMLELNSHSVISELLGDGSLNQSIEFDAVLPEEMKEKMQQ